MIEKAGGNTAEMDDRYLVPGLMRGLSILESFNRDRQEQTMAQMAKNVGLSRSTTFRLVYTLEAIGYLDRVGSGKSYRLGTKVLELGYSFLSGRELVDVARPLLEKLRDETSCSTHLVVREGVDIVYIARCSGNTRLVSGITVGTRLPAHATVSGRTILAHMPIGDIVGLYENYEFRRYTDSTITSLGELVIQLEKDRYKSSLISWGYFEPNIASIAAPVFNRASVIEASVIATCPIETYSKDAFESEIRIKVEKTAANISLALGYQPKQL
ncbi:hypothetical protein HY3_16080 [Hyphomonas pacifica]|uniref:Uncharacterized protein n=2 Tax=Hyphomonas pacifica TaxID=1280941 RepID=A0A062TQ43_9PROT|nr:hypothetical protein HY2_15295 [Hyphomonas pacifica]RAN31896.1 hypothetical protein HY3_16080 [Hyphomonas pacifica]